MFSQKSNLVSESVEFSILGKYVDKTQTCLEMDTTLS